MTIRRQAHRLPGRPTLQLISWTPYVIVPLGVATMHVVLAVFAVRNRIRRGGPHFVVLMLAIAVWLFAEGASIVATDPSHKLWLSKLRYLGIVLISPLIFTIAMHSWRGPRSLGPRALGALCAIPTLGLAALVTNEHHWLFWTSHELVDLGGAQRLVPAFGPGFWVMTVHQSLLVFFAIAIFVWATIRGEGVKRKDMLLAIPAILAPLVVSTIFVASPQAARILDPTPIAVGFSSILIGWGMLRLGLTDVTKVANEEIVQSLADAIVVLDATDRIVSFNPAAESLLELYHADIGELLDLALARQPEVAAFIRAALQAPAQLQIAEPAHLHLPGVSAGVGPRGGWYEMKLAPLRDTFGNESCQILSLRDITPYKDAERRIRALAYYDSLTGLPNRERFHLVLSHIIAEPRSTHRCNALLFLDLDRFKDVNDTLGHVAGDVLLSEVARRLVDCVRASDRVVRRSRLAGEEDEESVSRLGGDEFTVLLPGLRGPLDAAIVARRLIETLAAPFDIDGYEVVSGVSIGIAIHPDDGEDVETLLRNADTAMYVAKRGGTNEFAFYDDSMNARGARRLQLEVHLRQALARDQLSVFYQPLREATTGRLDAVEALLRWELPDEGFISPEEFIGIAEDTGLIHDIGDWVLHTACRQIVAWDENGYRPIRVAVNISSHQLRRTGFAGRVEQTLRDTGLDATRLELELTESSIMGEDDGTQLTIGQVHELGVNLSLDDFGTGYSSLSYLRRFPLHRVKIDRSFVRDLVEDEDDRNLAAAIVAMARLLGLRVVAEGVESVEQAEILRELGCHELQGYLLGRPVPAAELERSLDCIKGEDEPNEEPDPFPVRV